MSDLSREQELEELREQAEKGRKAEITLEFVQPFLTQQRAFIFTKMETMKIDRKGAADIYAIYLQVLSMFEKDIVAFLQIGDIAREKLKNN